MPSNVRSPAAVIRERILRMLAKTSNPLSWAELTGALGLLSNDVSTACEWLMDHGYIAPIRLWNERTQSVEALWTLGERGIVWAQANCALGTRPGRWETSPPAPFPDRDSADDVHADPRLAARRSEGNRIGAA